LFVSLDQTPKPAPAPQSRRSPEKNITSRALPPELTNSRDELCISYRAIETLTPYAGNARVHSRAQIRKIKESIEAFGFLDPILITSGGTIIAGHGRVQAAKLLSMAEVPTICLEGLSQAQIRAYALATNRIAQDSSWDKDILKIELQHLVSLNEIDVSLTGFHVAELDIILLPAGDAAEDAPDSLEASAVGPAITRPGDIWQLSDHRILCGNSLLQESFLSLLEGKRANVAFADVPFNVPIQGHVSGNGAIKHREFAMCTGEMGEEEFGEFLTTSLGLLARHSENGSVHFICSDWRMMGTLLAGEKVYEKLLNMCVWAKDNGGMGSFYRSQHELVFVFKNGAAPYRNNIQLGRFKRNRTNLWHYPGANTMSKQSDEGNLLALHPTVKPVALVADAILDCTAPGEIVLDSFLGSGSTLIAAERTRRICYGIEIDPGYVDVAVRRWQRHSGGQALRVADGKSFSEIAAKEKARG
jgi:DNA methylase/ParB-like nuclease domain